MRRPPTLSARQRQPEPTLTLLLLMSGNHPAAPTNHCREAGTHMREAKPAGRREKAEGAERNVYVEKLKKQLVTFSLTSLL